MSEDVEAWIAEHQIENLRGACVCGWSECDANHPVVRVGDLRALLRQLPADREALATLMLRHGIPTGHGDTHADLLVELEAHLRQLPGVVPEPPVEIRLTDRGDLDEVCARAASVHLEQMDHDHWYLGVGEVNVWFYAKGKITVHYEDNQKPTETPHE